MPKIYRPWLHYSEIHSEIAPKHFEKWVFCYAITPKLPGITPVSISEWLCNSKTIFWCVSERFRSEFRSNVTTALIFNRVSIPKKAIEKNSELFYPLESRKNYLIANGSAKFTSARSFCTFLNLSRVQKAGSNLFNAIITLVLTKIFRHDLIKIKEIQKRRK